MNEIIAKLYDQAIVKIKGENNMSCTYCGSKKHFVSSCPWISKNKTQGENMTIQEAMIEIDRLKQQIKYQEYREGRIGAHSPHCYTFGPHHYECALRKIEELESEADKFAEVIIKEFSTEGEREEIMAIAKQAGFERLGHTDDDWVCYPKDIKAFAELVAQAERKEWELEFAGMGEWACVYLLEERNR